MTADRSSDRAAAFAPTAPASRSRLASPSSWWSTAPAPPWRRACAGCWPTPAVDEFVSSTTAPRAEEVAVIDAAVRGRPPDDRPARAGQCRLRAAANLGAGSRSGHMIVFLNPDAFLEPGCIRALHRHAQGHAASRPSWARGCMNPDGTEQRGARRGEVTPVTTLLSLTGLRGGRRLAQLRDPPRGRARPRMRGIPVPTISGACFAMRRDDFVGLGGFDERLLPARGGRRPVLARAQGGRRGAVPAARAGRASGLHQPSRR